MGEIGTDENFGDIVHVHVYRNPDITIIKYRPSSNMFFTLCHSNQRRGKMDNTGFNRLKSDCIERKTKIVKTIWVNHIIK